VNLRKNSTAGAVLLPLPAVGGEQNMGNYRMRIKMRRFRPGYEALTRLGGRSGAGED
jgi:hypothetical protein